MDAINTMYIELFVVKRLPVVFKGRVSNAKLIVEASKIKFLALFSFTNFQFFKIEAINRYAMISIVNNPTIPVSVKISK